VTALPRGVPHWDRADPALRGSPRWPAGEGVGDEPADAAAGPDEAVLLEQHERLADHGAADLHVGMAHGPTAGIAALAPLLERNDHQRNHRVHAHLLELTGNAPAAQDA
jgi:hypothetical protein